MQHKMSDKPLPPGPFFVQREVRRIPGVPQDAIPTTKWAIYCMSTSSQVDGRYVDDPVVWEIDSEVTAYRMAQNLNVYGESVVTETERNKGINLNETYALKPSGGLLVPKKIEGTTLKSVIERGLPQRWPVYTPTPRVVQILEDEESGYTALLSNGEIWVQNWGDTDPKTGRVEMKWVSVPLPPPCTSKEKDEPTESESD